MTAVGYQNDSCEFNERESQTVDEDALAGSIEEPINTTQPVNEKQSTDTKQPAVTKQSGSDDPKRLVRLDDFQPAFFDSSEAGEEYSRRFGVLFIDESRARTGGLGRVYYGENAWGESCAIKILAPMCDTVHDTTHDDEQTPSKQNAKALQEAAFRREYETHRALSGVKGFPTLYGRGYYDGQQAIVMEWIEGETLEKARKRLALNDEGAISPLIAAALGRDLFDLLTRMELINPPVVHRDISPRNIMVCTHNASVEEQIEAGSFDLRLIDFGSGVQPMRNASLTQQHGVPRWATPDFAAPEMLSDDIPRVGVLRRNPVVDVYAASSVIYLLVSGHTPFNLSALTEDESVISPYLRKKSESPLPLVGAHDSSVAFEAVRDREKPLLDSMNVSTVVNAHGASDEQLREALLAADDQLNEIVLAGLEPDQALRPSAQVLKDAYEQFIALYPDNVSNVLQGKKLPPMGMLRPLEIGKSHKVTGSIIAKGFAGIVILGIALASGFASNGVWFQFTQFTPLFQGDVNGFLPACALLLPALLGYVVRGRDGATTKGFVRGSIVLAAITLVLMVLLLCTSFAVESLSFLLVWALIACAAAGWCGMVFDYIGRYKGGFR